MTSPASAATPLRFSFSPDRAAPSDAGKPSEGWKVVTVVSGRALATAAVSGSVRVLVRSAAVASLALSPPVSRCSAAAVCSPVGRSAGSSAVILASSVSHSAGRSSGTRGGAASRASAAGVGAPG